MTRNQGITVIVGGIHLVVVLVWISMVWIQSSLGTVQTTPTPESVSESEHIAEASKSDIKCEDIGRDEGPPLKSREGDSEGPGTSNPPSTNSRVFYVGRDVTAPELICRVEPRYTEEARQAKYQGTVVLSLVVQRDGSVRDIKILQPLKYGLNEMAIEAVQHWRFRPGMKSGTPVDVRKIVEVTFRLM